MLTAYDFTKGVNGDCSFSIAKEETAKALRELADKVESGDVILQAGRVVTAVKNDDFAMTFLRLQFHERRK